jgi:hypothetical protein
MTSTATEVNNTMSFEEWLNEVNRHVMETIDIGIEDLTEQPYTEWWQEGRTPEEGALLALEDNNYSWGDIYGYLNE